MNGTYRPICNQYWDDKDANVVCNYMGYGSNYYRKPMQESISTLLQEVTSVYIGGQTTANGTFGLSDQEPIVVNAACNGTEYGLEQCNGYSIGEAVSYYCQSGLYQAGVRCLEGLSMLVE